MRDIIYRRVFFFFACLLPIMAVYSQGRDTDSLQQLFTRYQLGAFQEKVFVHTNKTFYLAGEIAWFKLYDVDGYAHQPSTLSSVCYVELINKDQRPVLQAKIPMSGGSGNGSLTIPSAMPSGNYRFRAYTAWMKNFSPDFYYEQTIIIVNTLKEAAPAGQAPAAAYNVQFFPEGGNLVEGQSSKIAFKITNRYGQGIAGKGVVLSPAKDTVARFETLHDGMGSFVLTPAKGQTYTAVTRPGDTVLTQALPAAYAQGLTMHLAEAGNGRIEVTVLSGTAFSAKPVYLLVHTRQVLKSVQSSPITEGRAVFSIDRNILGDGISHFTVFNPDRQPVCERLYFKGPEKKLVIAATPDQQEYATRKKAVVSLQTEDAPGHAVAAGLSMAVFMIDSLQPAQYNNIVSYLLLESDLKGRVENPGYYFDSPGAEAAAAADNLMLTQGWRRFRWEEVLQDRHPYLEFLPEKEGLVINARVTDRKTGQPAKNTMAWLSVPGQSFVVNASLSHASGELRFNMTNFYGRNEIIAQTNGRTDSTYRVDIGSAYSDKFSATPLTGFMLSRHWKDQLEYRSINVQAENAYQVKDRERTVMPASQDTTRFFGTPDKRYYLDDYTRFVTMEEVMREYIAEVRIRKQSGKFNARVLNANFNVFFEDDPMILLDGVPVFDLDKVMALDPLKIKQVDVVTRKYYLGPLTSDGIISYKTYEGDLGGYPLDPNAVVVEYDGLQREREYYAPVYETAGQISSRVPDTRNALAWLPQINTGDDGKTQLAFYTSDLKGKYAVVVQGITAGGLPGSTLFIFTVR